MREEKIFFDFQNSISDLFGFYFTVFECFVIFFPLRRNSYLVNKCSKDYEIFRTIMLQKRIKEVQRTVKLKKKSKRIPVFVI